MAMNRKNVLWIDDEIEFLRAHIMFLETRGYSVTPVFSGDDGLHLIRESPDKFDILLVDEQMPGKDGLTVLSEVKEMLPDLPVVMVTKSEEEELMEKAIGKKIDGYLTKPVNPSQVLLVCKNLLQADEIVSDQVKRSFVKSYSDIKTRLKRIHGYKEWIKLYHSFVKRDIEIEDIDDEAIRQGHSGQKNEANSHFGDYIMSKYPTWLDETEPEKEQPILSNKILSEYLLPEVKSGKKVALLVLDSLRLDQYVVIQRILKKNFTSSNKFYLSILPTDKHFVLPSLLSTHLPKELSENHSDLWSDIESKKPNLEALYSEGLNSIGIDKNKAKFFDISLEENSIDTITKSISSGNIPVIYADILELFSTENQTEYWQEMAKSSKSFRNMSSEWFSTSKLLKLLKRLSSEEVTVILTPSSGNILCTRGTEYYGKDASVENSRCRYGNDLTCDERYGYLLTHPDRYGLPIKDEDTKCVILKENFHFVEHSTYDNYNDKYKNSYERGGVSMDEMILPLAILKPKVLDLDLDF